MGEKKQNRTVAIGLMLFALFFGAGNLIFPASMGQNAGVNVWWAVLGFVLTGVSLPLLGVLAIGYSGCKDLEELAGRLGVEAEELVQAMDSCTEVESLQKVISQGDSEGTSLLERVEQGRDEQEELLRRMLLEELLASLDPKERRLIVLRFFHDRTQSQVAEELGMSQVQVSRLEKKILLALKEKI